MSSTDGRDRMRRRRRCRRRGACRRRRGSRRRSRPGRRPAGERRGRGPLAVGRVVDRHLARLRVDHVARPEAVEGARRHVEAGVGHAERLEDALGMTSSRGLPAARATSTPSTSALVWYIQRSPGWYGQRQGAEAPHPLVGLGRPGRRRRPGAEARLGARRQDRSAGPEPAKSMPVPTRNVSRSRRVIARSAGTVSSSGPPGRPGPGARRARGATRPPGRRAGGGTPRPASGPPPR